MRKGKGGQGTWIPLLLLPVRVGKMGKAWLKFKLEQERAGGNGVQVLYSLRPRHESAKDLGYDLL